MRAQGYDIKDNILYQDNKSTILLATNGRMSASSRLKHVHTRFYLVKDHQDRGEVDVRYEPTGKMWSDIMTKPEQDKAYRMMRGMLMNIPEDYDDDVERRNKHPGLLPKIEPAIKSGSQEADTLRTVAKQDETLARNTTKSSGHRRSVLREKILASPKMSRVRTPYDTELAKRVSKRIRALRYLRDIKDARIRRGTRKAEVPMSLPLQ